LHQYILWQNSDWQKDIYEVSVPMSTYLIAYVISNFDSINKTSPNKTVLIEVAARPEAIKGGEGDFALEEAMIIIDFFADYFGIDYPLPKLSKRYFI
jgi:adipocyte-derived leucine aminopeptidase